MGGRHSPTIMLFLLFLGLAILGCHGMDFEKESFGRISSPDADCKYWTRQTVLVTPSTVATLKSQMVNVKKCATLFQLAGGCMKMKMNCPNFNVPKGPLRWFYRPTRKKIHQWQPTKELEVRHRLQGDVQRKETESFEVCCPMHQSFSCLKRNSLVLFSDIFEQKYNWFD